MMSSDPQFILEKDENLLRGSKNPAKIGTSKQTIKVIRAVDSERLDTEVKLNDFKKELDGEHKLLLKEENDLKESLLKDLDDEFMADYVKK